MGRLNRSLFEPDPVTRTPLRAYLSGRCLRFFYPIRSRLPWLISHICRGKSISVLRPGEIELTTRDTNSTNGKRKKCISFPAFRSFRYSCPSCYSWLFLFGGFLVFGGFSALPVRWIFTSGRLGSFERMVTKSFIFPAFSGL